MYTTRTQNKAQIIFGDFEQNVIILKFHPFRLPAMHIVSSKNHLKTPNLTWLITTNMRGVSFLPKTVRGAMVFLMKVNKNFL